MGFLKAAFLLSIVWCQIYAAPITENACPNDFSYNLGDNCYSLHTDLDFGYSDSVAHCEKYGGTLWSKTNEEEIVFLRKVNVKQSFDYWIGAQEEEYNWKYLSDHSPVSDLLINNKQQKRNLCLAINHSEHKMKGFPCKQKMQTVCEYTDDKCKVMGCYKLTNTDENFNNATITCKNLGARIAEVRNEDQLKELKEVIRRDKSFENIPEDQLKKFDGSKLPILWHLKQGPEDENVCEIYQNWTIQTTDCSGSRNFACKFDAIPITPEIIAVNTHPTEHSTEEKPTNKPDQGDVSNDSTATTALLIIMGIMIVILLIAIAFLVYRLRRAGNGGNRRGEEARPLRDEHRNMQDNK